MLASCAATSHDYDARTTGSQYSFSRPSENPWSQTWAQNGHRVLWRARRDSNPRHPASEAGTLSD